MLARAIPRGCFPGRVRRGPRSVPSASLAAAPAGARWGRLVRAARALSLDVVLGTLAGGAFAAALAGAEMPAAWWLALPGCTWVLYTVDHLLDARRSGAVAHTHRHRFHARHGRVLTLAVSAVAVAALAVSVLGLPPSVLAGGGILGAVAAGYLALCAAWPRPGARYPKEIVAAALYTTGIWFGPLLLAPGPSAVVWIAAALHGVAALANLWMISVLEESAGRAGAHASMVIAFGRCRVALWLRAATLAGLSVTAATAVAAPRVAPSLGVLALLVAAPAWMLRNRRRMVHGERYRIWGDLLFALLALPGLLPGA